MDGLVAIDGRDYADSITLRQLLSHRAGVANTDNDLEFVWWVMSQPQRRRTPREILAHARRIGGVAVPGTQTSYASPGYTLAALVLERAAGQPFHQLVRRELLERLGMHATFDATHEWPRDRATLHHYLGSIDFSRFDPSFEFGDGGYVSRANAGIGSRSAARYAVPSPCAVF